MYLELKYQGSLFSGFTKIITRETTKHNLNLGGTDEFRQNEGGNEPYGKYAFFFRMKNSYPCQDTGVRFRCPKSKSYCLLACLGRMNSLPSLPTLILDIFMDSLMVTAGRRLTNKNKHQRLRETETVVQRNQEVCAIIYKGAGSSTGLL
jgi:hypothetical protein